MQIKKAILAGVLMSSFVFAVCGETIDAEAKLTEFAEFYLENLSKIEATREEAGKAVKNRYISELKALESSYQKIGDLEGVLLVRKEQDRFKATPTIQTENFVKTLDGLLRLQKAFVAASAQADQEKTASESKLKSAYVTALNQLKKELTQQNQIDAAVKAAYLAESLLTNQGVPAKIPGSLPEPSSDTPLTMEQRLREKLLLHYSMDKVLGDKLVDLSDSALDGKVMGAEQITDPERGGCLSFDGNDHISCGKDERLNLRDNFTVSIWIRPEILGGGRGIVSKYQRSKGAFTLRLGVKSDPKLTAGDFYRKGTINTILETGQWYHVGVVMKNGVIQVYLNGKLENSSAKGGLLTANDDAMKIGVCYTNRFFKGAMDELRIYTRPLSPGEIQTLARK